MSDMDRYLLISVDCHAGPRPEDIVVLCAGEASRAIVEEALERRSKGPRPGYVPALDGPATGIEEDRCDGPVRIAPRRALAVGVVAPSVDASVRVRGTRETAELVVGILGRVP